MSEFTDWLIRTGRERGLDTEAAISRAINTDQAVVGRWKNQGKIPDITLQRRISEGLGVPIQEVLVASGYVKPDEVGVVRIERRVDELSDEELLAEVARRMADTRQREVVARRSTSPAHPGRQGRGPREA